MRQLVDRALMRDSPIAPHPGANDGEQGINRRSAFFADLIANQSTSGCAAYRSDCAAASQHIASYAAKHCAGGRANLSIAGVGAAAG